VEILLHPAAFSGIIKEEVLSGGSMTSPNIPVLAPQVKGRHKLLVAVILVLGVALVSAVFLSHRGLYQIYRFRQEKTHLDQENARLAAENERLAHTIDRLQNDPEMIQDLIRRELNFVRKNDIILQLPPTMGATPPIPAAPAKPEPGALNGPKNGAPGAAASKGNAWGTLDGAPKQETTPSGTPPPRGN
jgi:cell division protein FtsB